MEKVSILHLITAAKNASPFDVNMAFDAGFDNIMPYTNVTLNEVAGLVQDAIFSRSPSGIKREGIFIGGRDIDLAMDMFESAQKAMFNPFEVSVFADPSGAFTTAAAMVAKVELHLKRHFQTDLHGKHVAVFGATGPVGGCAAVIAAKQGAKVELVAHRTLADVQQIAQHLNQRYGIALHAVEGVSEASKLAILAKSDIALCTAAAGVRVIQISQISASANLKIIADVNAVAPSGAEGVEAGADGVRIAETSVLGIGALAIGNLKYKTQHQLLESMLIRAQTKNKPNYLEFMAAFNVARALSAEV
ncbi:MAG TPA: methylenetetrahydromethanopterin dehydrogenase [Methylotenera sp.]|nr:methylenetetrahydromethanopterin dehydrogenase [Methylotenera sp.]